MIDHFGLLVANIADLLTSKDRVVVGISGFGGSGKSTLASRLARHFGVAEAQIVRGDSLCSTNPTGLGLFDYTDADLLRNVLEDAHSAERLRYVGRNYQGNRVPVDETMPAIVIFEGIRLFRPELMGHYDVAIWMNCPAPLALERAKARNREQGDSEAEIALWDTLWAPLDARYVAEYEPSELATFVYDSSG